MEQHFAYLEKEVFEDFINGAQFRITDAGPLHSPAASLSIKRDKKLNIILESILEQGADSAYVAPSAGTVTMISGKAELRSIGGMTAVAEGISPLGTRSKWNEKSGVFALTERASLNTIEIDLHGQAPQAYLVEWFLVSSYPLIWPEASNTQTTLHHTLLIPDGPEGLNIRLESTMGLMWSRDTMSLNVEGHRIYLREVQSKFKKTASRSCMLIYCDETTSEFRRKLQDCIAFALGRYLVYLGHTGFSEGWKITGVRGVRGYSINKSIFKLPPHPPSLLSADSYNMLDAVVFNKSVSALCANYDVLHLSHLSWGYWHAMCAPAHIGAAHYGAIIEALRDAYVRSRPELRGGQIVTDSVAWAKVSSGMLALLDSAGLDGEARRMLGNKVSNLNSRPASSRMELVCRNIGIQLGNVEMEALRRGRNNAAHGARINPGEHVQVVRDIKLLNIILVRMLTAMTGASDSYIDYYSYGHPVRFLSEPVPS